MAKYQALKSQDIARFHEDGYLILPVHQYGLIPDVSILQEWLEEVFAWPHEKNNWMLYEETSTHGERQLLGTERIIEDHDGLKSVLCANAMFELLRELTGKEVLLFKDEIAWKLPGGNGAVPHVDLPAYGHLAPQFVEIMIAVDDHTVENGCLEFVVGSHKDDVPFSKNGTIETAWASKHTFSPIILKPGEAVFFGERMAHRLKSNSTKSPRRALFGTYHFDLEKHDLREQFFAHRMIHVPPANA